MRIMSFNQCDKAITMKHKSSSIHEQITIIYMVSGIKMDAKMNIFNCRDVTSSVLVRINRTEASCNFPVHFS